MTSYHWLTGGISTTWTNTTPPNHSDSFSIPAGGEVRKVLVNKFQISGVQTGQNYNIIAPFHIQTTATFTAGPHSGRQVAGLYCRIPGQITALYDPLTAQRIYTQYFWGGDETFLVNEKMAYGTRSGAAATLQVGVSIVYNLIAGLTYTSSGFFGYSAKVLYSTNP